MFGKAMKLGVLAMAGVALVAAPVAAQETGNTAGKVAKGARVSGSAQIKLTFSPDQDVRAFTFDVTGVPYSEPKQGAPQGLPTDARGTVQISHHSPREGWTVTSKAKVDCLVTSPGNATLTAVVYAADEPIKDWIGKRLGFSVHDGRGGEPDRMGFSWAVVNGVQNDKGEWEEGKVGTCMGPAAFAPVTKGGYRVEHADLLPQPK
ncbi:hypothetical protein [Actinomadura chibensis]|uniref:Uncharacterized protein n=1 Tax=Actinomadura chibensis TaxID=392828 RepID=A0A5D0N914_9ACTN|nr:hypothetical protein [Actinomadura chibensis]TYB40832.1 hypothetical protein FXF69_38105 [Actinomadura chibensis]